MKPPIKTESLIEKFFDIISQCKFDIRNDREWPIVFEGLIRNTTEKLQKENWFNLEKAFKEKEKHIGYCHKGHIYWRLAFLNFIQGDIDNCISYLIKSRDEDNKQNPAQFTASKGFLSVLQPLLVRYKDRKRSWALDESVKKYYLSLSDQEKREFATLLSTAHNYSAQSSAVYIKDEYFNFIIDERIRLIVANTYKEVKNTIFNPSLPSYYSCVFAIGSILEAMLDDLFQRDNERIWKIFHSKIANKKEITDTLMKSSHYQSGMTLGKKIMVIRLMSKYNLCPLPKLTILHLIILGEYRDLIHPRRRLDFEFEANWYVAATLFTFISQIAGNWWPESINKQLQ